MSDEPRMTDEQRAAWERCVPLDASDEHNRDGLVPSARAMLLAVDARLRWLEAQLVALRAANERLEGEKRQLYVALERWQSWQATQDELAMIAREENAEQHT